MRDNHDMHHHSGGGFFNGLLWGLIIGAALAFLLGTKKGKRLLKIIAEEGFEGVSDLEDLVNEVSEEKGLTPEPVVKDASSHRQTNGAETNNHHETLPAAITHFPRRFFRGIPKRG